MTHIEDTSKIDVYGLMLREAEREAAEMLARAKNEDEATGIFRTMRTYAATSLFATWLLSSDHSSNGISGQSGQYSDGQIDTDEACRSLTESVERIAEVATLIALSVETERSEQLEGHGPHISATVDRGAVNRLNELLTQAREILPDLLINGKVGNE